MVWEFNVTIGSDLSKYDYINGNHLTYFKVPGLLSWMSFISIFALSISLNEFME
jgi:hypothetical protein